MSVFSNFSGSWGKWLAKYACSEKVTRVHVPMSLLQGRTILYLLAGHLLSEHHTGYSAWPTLHRRHPTASVWDSTTQMHWFELVLWSSAALPSWKPHKSTWKIRSHVINPLRESYRWGRAEHTAGICGKSTLHWALEFASEVLESPWKPMEKAGSQTSHLCLKDYPVVYPHNHHHCCLLSS